MSKSRTPQRKKANARRRQAPSQRQELIDTGTPEADRRRQELIGRNADPTMAVDPIGILAARGHLGSCERLIDQRLKAGRRFSDLRSFIFGNLLPRETLIHRVVMGGGASSGRDPFLADQAEVDQRLRDAYERGLAAVKAVSRAAVDEVVRLCHRQQMPDWSARLRAGLGQAGDFRAQSNLLDALDALSDCYGYRSHSPGQSQGPDDPRAKMINQNRDREGSGYARNISFRS